jgi:transposase InsO family protein
MRYAFIQRQAAQLPVRTMCRLLDVHPSGYYAWTTTGRLSPPCQREARQLQLTESIRLVHERSGGTYGSPRVHQALKKQGVICSRKRVAKLMRQAQIRSTRHRRFRVRTTDSNHEHPLAQNLLDRQFEQETINQAWVSDITYVATDQGWLYVASVMDLCSRRIIGWATAEHLRAELATEALIKAIRQRCPTEGLLHHSDRGVQYACGEYQALLARHGITCSMSRSGNCYDNASMESFFKTFKVELVYQEHYATRAEAGTSIHSYIEVFYNRQRLHSSLGYRSPAEYEAELGQQRTRRAHS